MKNRGMTLIELMVSVGILTAVMGTLFTLSIGFGDTARLQDIQLNAHDEARRALQMLVADMHQAARSSINWTALPGDTLTYRVATDSDGNGVAVDVNGQIELSAPRTIGRDTEDANGDRQGVTQLVARDGDALTVLANGLSPASEQPTSTGAFGAAQDTNGNGRLDRGIWFEPWGRGIRITIQTMGITRQGREISTTFSEIVFPRN